MIVEQRGEEEEEQQQVEQVEEVSRLVDLSGNIFEHHSPAT